MSCKILGVIINPIAGMGGSVGLHGTDGEARRRAEALGAVPIAGKRAIRGLRRLGAAPGARVLAAGGPMGEDIVRSLGWEAETAGPPPSAPTTREDTQAAARAMREAGVDLLLFAGGDGTARDIAEAVGRRIPLLGIPTGVKMHSAVFGGAPEAAGELAARFLQNPGGVELRKREVLDVQPDSGEVGGFLMVSVPYARGLLQSGKATSPVGDDRLLDMLCAEIAGEMEPDRLYILGPGTTVGMVLEHLGLEGTMTGVDAVANGRLAARDASEARLLELLAEGRGAAIILGVIGGQGFLLGRGNQQLSPPVVRRVGEDNVIILASEEKLRSLDPPVLRVDMGVEEPDPALLGYRQVRTAPGQSIIMKVVS